MANLSTFDYPRTTNLPSLFSSHTLYLKSRSSKGSLLNLSNQNLSNSKFSKYDFSQATFTNCDFSNSTFTSCTFSHTNFINCNFSNASFLNSSFSYCNIKHSTFINTTSTNSTGKFFLAGNTPIETPSFIGGTF